MTSEHQADAEAIAKLRAWQEAGSDNVYRTVGIRLAFPTEVELIEKQNGTSFFRRIPTKRNSLPAAVDAALEAWDAMERGQG